MAILGFFIDSIGQSGQRPRLIYINTNNTAAQVVVPGFLEPLVSQGAPLSEDLLAVVSTRETPSSKSTDVNLFNISVTHDQWSLVASSGSTPTIRGSNIQSSSNSSYTVSWPTGTLEGDMVFIFGGHGFSINTPTGWALIGKSDGANWNGATIFKVLTAADILTGSVTVTAAGSFNGVLACISLVGSTVRKFAVPAVFLRDGTGSTSVSIPIISAGASNLILLFACNRGTSTNTFSTGISQQSINATNASACLFAFTPVSGLITTASFSSAGSGYYIASLALAGP